MPIVIIIVGLAVIIGVGSFFLRPVVTEITSDTPTDTNSIGVHTNDVMVAHVMPTSTPIDSTVASTNDNPTNNTPISTTPLTPAASVITPTPATPAASEVTDPVVTTVYADGTHTVTTSYKAPGSNNHTLTATITLADDIVTDSTVTFGGDRDGESISYQKRFLSNYQSQVIGKKLTAIKLSRVGGASLTTESFNNAIALVKTTAKN